MLRFFSVLLLMLIVLLGCSAISNINDMPKSKLLTSQTIDEAGGTIEYRKTNSHSNGISIVVEKGTVSGDADFSILYFESFPRKPKNLKPESIAFEIKFEAKLNKRVKIVIPFISDDAVQNGLALFTFDMVKRKWHFAGGTSVNDKLKTVSAFIDSPGIFAVMSLEGGLPSEAYTDFEVGFDTFNAESEFTKKYCNAITSYSYWFYNNKRDLPENLYDKYPSKVSLIVARAASWEYYNTQFTSASQLAENALLSGITAAKYIRTALAFENRPIVAVLNSEYTIVINKYQNHDFYCYDPNFNKVEQKLGYDPISGDLVYNNDVIDKIAFFGTLSANDAGFQEIYAYFEDVTTNVLSQVVGPLGEVLHVNAGNLAGFDFNITQYAVTNDIRILVDEINLLPNPPMHASWYKPLFRLLGPIDSMFDQPVEITIHYSDADNDGILDGTNVAEQDIHIASYNFDANSWATAEIISKDTFFNTLTVKSHYASDYGMFYFEPLTIIPRAKVAATTVFNNWTPGESEETLIENCSLNNLNCLNISAFECVGSRQFEVRFKKNATMTAKLGFRWYHSWYTYTYLINKAFTSNVDVNMIISCFSTSLGSFVDDVDNPDSHAYYIVETLLSYILEHFTGIKGIILRDVRFDRRTHTQFELDLLAKFIRRAREKIGRKSSDNVRLILELEPTTSSDCCNEFGQRLTDFAKYADSLLLKVYDDLSQPFNQLQTRAFIEHAQVACTLNNGNQLLVKVSSGMNANVTTLEGQLANAMKFSASGFSIHDYTTTSTSEWSAISRFTPQN